MDVCGVGKVCGIEAKAEETQLKQLLPASGQRRHFPGYPGDVIDYVRRPGGGLGHDSPGMRTHRERLGFVATCGATKWGTEER